MNYMDVDGPEFLLEVHQAISNFRSQSLNDKSIQNESQDYWSTTPAQNNYQQVIVLDTNFFISNLGYLKQLITIAERQKGCILIVPWVVIQELDGLKDPIKRNRENNESKKISDLARSGIRFLEELLLNRSSALRGQKTTEIYDKDIVNMSNCLGDDRILDCCLYFRYKLEKPVKLLSNDRNLCVKAMVHCIEAVSSESKQKMKELLDLISLGQNVMQIEPSIQYQQIIDEDCEMMDSPIVIIEDNNNNFIEETPVFNGGGIHRSKYASKNYNYTNNNSNNTSNNVKSNDNIIASRQGWHNVFYKTGMDLKKR